MKLILTNVFVGELIKLFLLAKHPDTPDSDYITRQTALEVEKLLIGYFNGTLDVIEVSYGGTDLSYEVADHLNIVYLDVVESASVIFNRSLEPINPKLLTSTGDMLVELIPIID